MAATRHFFLAFLLIFAVPVQATGCGDEATAGAAGYYVVDGQLWKESNSQPGLQRGPCIDGQGRDQPGDEMVGEVPDVPPVPQPPPRFCFPSGSYQACLYWGGPMPNLCLNTPPPPGWPSRYCLY